MLPHQWRTSLPIAPAASKMPEDLLEMSARVLKARKQSAEEFVKHFSTTIQDYDSQWALTSLHPVEHMTMGPRKQGLHLVVKFFFRS